MIEALLVEGKPADARLTQPCEGRVGNHLRPAHGGVKARAFIRRGSTFADGPPPHLILLDLDLLR